MFRSRWVVFVVAVVGICILIVKSMRGGSGSRKIEAKPPTKRSKSRRSPEADEVDTSSPQLLMLLGIPGSGKSTWAKEFVFRCDSSFTVVSSDDVRRQLTGSVDDQSRNAEVWDVVLNRCQGLLEKGRNVILDATNTSTEKRRRFVKQLPKCQRFLKVFPINKSIAKGRIARDIEQGIDRAKVPDSAIDVMFRQFQDSLVAVRDEGWKMK
jgi:predicted kinase